MAIEAMTYVWEHSRHKGGELLTLLAIANCTRPDGTYGYPSIPELAKKTRMTERNVQLVIKKLIASGELILEPGTGPHGKHTYTIPMSKGEKISPEKISGMKRFRGEKSGKSGVKSAAENAAPPSLSPSDSPSSIPPVPDPSLDPSPLTPHTDEGVNGVVRDYAPARSLYEPDTLAESLRTPPVAWRDDCKTVLDYLNAVTGRNYQEFGNIQVLITKGVKVAVLLLVIDWWKVVFLFHHPNQHIHFDTDTPFNPTKFDKYRASAEQWEAEGRSPPQIQEPKRRSPVEERRADNAERKQNFIGGKTDGRSSRKSRGVLDGDGPIIDCSDYHID